MGSAATSAVTGRWGASPPEHITPNQQVSQCSNLICLFQTQLDASAEQSARLSQVCFGSQSAGYFAGTEAKAQYVAESTAEAIGGETPFGVALSLRWGNPYIGAFASKSRRSMSDDCDALRARGDVGASGVRGCQSRPFAWPSGATRTNERRP